MKKIYSLFLILSFITLSYPQSIIEPVDENVYSFIDRLAVKGILKSLPAVKPYTREEIKNYLLEAEKSGVKLTGIELDELDWYKKEYVLTESAGGDLAGAFFNNTGRFRMMYYKDSSFTFNLSPSLKYSFYKDGEFDSRRIWGFSSYGELKGIMGFRLDFREHLINADNIISKNYYGREQGYLLSYTHNKNSVSFSTTSGSLIYHNGLITAGIIKEDMKFGSAYSSSLVLSDKAPSFPTLYLKINPVDWLQIYFMHGWLHSSVVDSSKLYETDFNGHAREVEQEKYYVMHALQVNPWSNFSFTLGETIIYSDRNIYLGYFIPFLFYRSVDHGFTFGGGESGNNGSIFADVNYLPFSGWKFYGSLFIDEMSLTNLLKGETDRNQLGYTAGVKNYGLMDNISFNLEYTRILPWVYSDWIPSQTYTNSQYLLGHYIGQNADEIYASVDWQILANLKANFNGTYIRRGGTSDISNQYSAPGEDFLYGLKRKDTILGISLLYEYMHSLKAGISYTYTYITDEDKTRTRAWQLGAKNTFGMVLSYGL